MYRKLAVIFLLIFILGELVLVSIVEQKTFSFVQSTDKEKTHNICFSANPDKFDKYTGNVPFHSVPPFPPYVVLRDLLTSKEIYSPNETVDISVIIARMDDSSYSWEGELGLYVLTKHSGGPPLFRFNKTVRIPTPNTTINLSFQFKMERAGEYGIVATLTNAVISIAYMPLKVVPMPTTVLIFPNVGENWTVGSHHNITWLATTGNTQFDLTLRIKLEYSITGANGTYLPIAENILNTGSYLWKVPDNPSNNVFVRITATDIYGRCASDVSDGAFTIYRPLQPKPPDQVSKKDTTKLYIVLWAVGIFVFVCVLAIILRLLHRRDRKKEKKLKV